jgi:hypothetical protein
MIGRMGADSVSSPVLFWKSTDGGHTWKDIATQSFGGTSIDATGFSLLTHGFALDAQHIWIGGHDGKLFANDNGGL